MCDIIEEIFCDLCDIIIGCFEATLNAHLLLDDNWIHTFKVTKSSMVFKNGGKGSNHLRMCCVTADQ